MKLKQTRPEWLEHSKINSVFYFNAASKILNYSKKKKKKLSFCSGYMSPEYQIDGYFSLKSDVFSFGVLVLEIVSGRRNRGFRNEEHKLNLLGHVSTLAQQKN